MSHVGSLVKYIFFLETSLSLSRYPRISTEKLCHIKAPVHISTIPMAATTSPSSFWIGDVIKGAPLYLPFSGIILSGYFPFKDGTCIFLSLDPIFRSGLNWLLQQAILQPDGLLSLLIPTPCWLNFQIFLDISCSPP